MNPYSEGFRRRVRDAWISGEYASMVALAKAFGISRGIVVNWRREENWDDLKKKIKAQSEEQVTANLVEQLSQVNVRHFSIWRAIDHQVFSRLSSAHENKTRVPLDDLEIMSRILERSQRGQRIALGVDKPDQNVTNNTIVEFVYDGIEAALLASGNGKDLNGGNGSEPIDLLPEPDELNEEFDG